MLSFGAAPDCDARLAEVCDQNGGSRVRAHVLGRDLDFWLGAPGVHMAQNALGVLLDVRPLRREPADDEAVAHGVGEGLVEIVRRRLTHLLGARMNEVLDDGRVELLCLQARAPAGRL